MDLNNNAHALSIIDQSEASTPLHYEAVVSEDNLHLLSVLRLHMVLPPWYRGPVFRTSAGM